MNIENIKLGDILWAKRFKNKLEKSSIPEGHQNGPFIVIKKTNKRVYALMATSKPNKTPWDLKLKISKMPINTKETYVFLGKVFIINKNNFIKIMGNISNEDLEIIKKRLYILHNKEYKMKFITNKDLSFNYNMGDIVTYKHKKFYIEKVGYNYVYAYKLKEVRDNTKINIFNKYYEINPILNKIPINKIKLIEVVTLSQRNYIKNILIKIHKIEVGKLITYNKKKYFIYKMDSSGIKAILLNNKYHTKVVIDNNRYFSNLEIYNLKKDKKMQVKAIANNDELEKIIRLINFNESITRGFLIKNDSNLYYVYNKENNSYNVFNVSIKKLYKYQISINNKPYYTDFKLLNISNNIKYEIIDIAKITEIEGIKNQYNKTKQILKTIHTNNLRKYKSFVVQTILENEVTKEEYVILKRKNDYILIVNKNKQDEVLNINLWNNKIPFRVAGQVRGEDFDKYMFNYKYLRGKKKEKIEG